MRKIIYNILPALIIMLSAGCSDFFNTDPYDIINSDNYISEQSEMYSGFLGILTKMQDVADHRIYLTDLRGDFVEPTTNADHELWDIYNYKSTAGNSWADPAGYYDLIIACNDYIHKMFEYKERIGAAMDEKTENNFKCLISGALRVKCWTYLTLGNIYGKAVYFDDPILELQQLKEGTVYTKLNSMDAIVDKCLDLLDTGVEGINGTYVIDWGEWLDPEDPNNAIYIQWDYVIPDWLCLKAELYMWKGNYAWVREQILTLFAEVFASDGYKYRLNAGWTSNYWRIFAQGTYYSRETIASAIYDYSNNQTNGLVTNFAIKYPCKFLFKPTTHAMKKYNSSDARGNSCYFRAQDGDTVISKYHRAWDARTSYQSDASVPLQRVHDLHFMLAEAENHLGFWDPSRSILNGGINGRFPTLIVDTSLQQWSETRYQGWLDNASYKNIGICGCVNATQHVLPTPDDTGYDLTEAERIRVYDMALLDEMLLEYAAEGRSYGMMIRMAKKYNDYSIIADRVCPKYDESQQAAVRSAIEAGGYYVDWDLGF